MKSIPPDKLMIFSLTLLILLACNGTFTSAFPTQTNPVPTATALPPSVTPTPPVTLSSVPLHEQNQNPNYEIKATVPALDGSTDPRVVNFNTIILNLVNGEGATFKKNVSELPANSVSPGSSLDVTYTLILQHGDLWSLKFDFLVYLAGAAHPYHYSLTVNYDLGQGRQLALSSLFLPGSNYLETISSYCIAELRKQPYSDSFSLGGASPAPENYRKWNITTDGLLITFDQYQVAPGAAGSQKIVVPYSELQPLIDPQGPLARLTQ